MNTKSEPKYETAVQALFVFAGILKVDCHLPLNKAIRGLRYAYKLHAAKEKARHIVPGHPEMGEHLENVKIVTSSPTIIYQGRTPERLIFTSSVITTAKGAPLTVIVDQNARIVCTAHFNQNLSASLVKKWP